MYAWKLWRDSRSRLLVCAVVGLIWLGAVLYAQTKFVHISRLPNDQGFSLAWNAIAASVQSPLVVIALLASLFLSEASLGSEFGKNTAEVLLTRPRRRRYFAWTGWSFAMAQILAIMYLLVACTIGVLAYLTSTVLSWRLLALPILVLPGVALLFGLGYVISVLSDGKHGAVLAFGALIAYYGAVAVAAQYWHIHYPPSWWFDELPFWATRGTQGAFPALPLLGWMAVALLFPLAVQWSLERKEI